MSVVYSNNQQRQKFGLRQSFIDATPVANLVDQSRTRLTTPDIFYIFNYHTNSYLPAFESVIRHMQVLVSDCKRGVSKLTASSTNKKRVDLINDRMRAVELVFSDILDGCESRNSEITSFTHMYNRDIAPHNNSSAVSDSVFNDRLNMILDLGKYAYDYMVYNASELSGLHNLLGSFIRLIRVEQQDVDDINNKAALLALASVAQVVQAQDADDDTYTAPDNQEIEEPRSPPTQKYKKREAGRSRPSSKYAQFTPELTKLVDTLLAQNVLEYEEIAKELNRASGSTLFKRKTIYNYVNRQRTKGLKPPARKK